MHADNASPSHVLEGQIVTPESPEGKGIKDILSALVLKV